MNAMTNETAMTGTAEGAPTARSRASAASMIGEEVLKLRTTRGHLVIAAAAQLVVIIGVSGLFVSGRDPNDPAARLAALSHVGLASIFSLVLGVFAVAGEYRYKTITDTYLSRPRRGQVIAAKLVVYPAAGAVIGLASSVTAVAITQAWLAADGRWLDLSDPDPLRTIVGCVAWNAAFAAIGVGVGALVRRLSAAIAGALAWLALGEGLVGRLIGDLGRWLPFSSGLALENAKTPGLELLPQWVGGLVLAGYAAIFAVLATWTTVKRDVF